MVQELSVLPVAEDEEVHDPRHHTVFVSGRRPRGRTDVQGGHGQADHGEQVLQPASADSQDRDRTYHEYLDTSHLGLGEVHLPPDEKLESDSKHDSVKEHPDESVSRYVYLGRRSAPADIRTKAGARMLG